MYRAKVKVLFDNKVVKAGDTFETDEATGLILIEHGWAEKIEKKKPVKRTRKKA